ncbi:hypothetical protein AVMA1855_08910 [Acidovorax sp. SUPP1855]|uniref:hypothetical protein n=1 Tax=Acidovorax sp. SUPP1855 TaxID=431774 RepID=UPI0023DE255C|nr:hypothetical protein [Acidovorax sp. SUPP1855]GKS84256.1 hypothetical protein AVMA1855_08910 [Acidovorax sp. SUPP1855]
MSGLIFLVIFGMFLCGCIWLAKHLGNLVPNPSLRSAVRIVILFLLLASPLVDEVIGKYQFEALCRANGIESANVSKAQGKRVRLDVGIKRPLYGMIMPGTVEDWFYRDVDSNEIVIQHKAYFAFGGWLMRYSPLNMGSRHPIFFPGGCPVDYLDRDSIFSKNNITLVN